ncbi:pyridoxamine phosphate oxidase family protein [Ceratocystis lukuohia]|uniref:Pyridoxamine phosphate oxidase family protein n=1 Tax=Ceratocystis lukuohia TaxID=2019550 RepID=A0ABR4MRL8_9PEZI
MPQYYSEISDDLAAWAQKQPLFFTASAPLHGSHINVSPKGLNAHFRVISPTKVAYIDRTGSGCETIAHAYEPCNARLTLLFISFGRAPRILRLFCTSSVVEWDQPAFEGLVRQVADGKRSVFDGARAVVVCQIFKVQTSCGYGVPMIKPELYDGSLLLQGATSDERQAATTQSLTDELSVFADRPTLDNWVAKKVASNTALQYQVDNNLRSLNGLPGLRSAQRVCRAGVGREGVTSTLMNS